MTVVGVATAIPAFIGFTDKYPTKTYDCTDPQPIKVNSLAEYVNQFGTAPNEQLSVTLTQSNPPFTINRVQTKLAQIMYYNMQMFFNNGGSTCYVVSVGTGTSDASSLNANFQAGLDSLKKKEDGVATAIPAFIGITYDGTTDSQQQPFGQPIKISSLSEYTALFGKATNQKIKIAATCVPPVKPGGQSTLYIRIS